MRVYTTETILGNSTYFVMYSVIVFSSLCYFIKQKKSLSELTNISYNPPSGSWPAV